MKVRWSRLKGTTKWINYSQQHQLFQNMKFAMFNWLHGGWKIDLFTVCRLIPPYPGVIEKSLLSFDSPRYVSFERFVDAAAAITKAFPHRFEGYMGWHCWNLCPKVMGEICGQSDVPAILGSRCFPTIKTYLSSPEAPKNLDPRVRQSPRTLTLSCLRATPQCRRAFFCFLGWYLGEGLL